jgi:hypothetical protein
MNCLRLKGMEGVEVTAQEVAEKLLGFLSEDQKEEAAQHGKLLRPNGNGSISIWFFNRLSARVYIKQIKYVSVPKRFVEDVKIDLPQDSLKTGPSFIRFHIRGLADVVKMRDLLLDIFETRREEAMGFQVGCCHLYLDCSDALECLNKNNFIRSNCLYKKNLEQGRIFYGKNRNLDRAVNSEVLPKAGCLF